MNYFEELVGVNVSDKIEKKNGLSYLSWAWAWGELKKRYPTAQYKVYEREDGCNYFTDGRTCWVKVSVTVWVEHGLAKGEDFIAPLSHEIEHIEQLPVMDFKNRSIPLESVTSMDVNKAIQRALTKAIARHGLGLYIYAGEDLPETPPVPPTTCSKCGEVIVAAGGATAEQLIAATTKKYGAPICKRCIDKQVALRKLEEQKEIPVEVVEDGNEGVTN